MSLQSWEYVYLFSNLLHQFWLLHLIRIIQFEEFWKKARVAEPKCSPGPGPLTTDTQVRQNFVEPKVILDGQQKFLFINWYISTIILVDGLWISPYISAKKAQKCFFPALNWTG